MAAYTVIQPSTTYAYPAVQFCSYMPYVLRSTIGLLSDSCASCSQWHCINGSKCEENISKIVIQFLPGSVVTQTVLGGLTTVCIIQLQISYSVLYTRMCQNYED